MGDARRANGYNIEKGVTMHTAKEIAEKLNVSVMSVHRFVRDGLITAYKIGNQVRITEEDYQAYLERNKTSAKSKS